MRARMLLPALLAVLALPGVAGARTDSEYAYPFARVWTASVRLLRIDMGCPITEKDKEEGFFFFEYPGESGPLPGSVELIRSRVDGVEGVKVFVQVPAMPTYVERMVLDKLGRKLAQEFGRPLLPKEVKEPSKPAAKSAEANKDSADEKKREQDKREQEPKDEQREAKQK